MACASANYRRWQSRDPAHAKARTDVARASWMERNPDWARKDYLKHRDKKLARTKKWAEANVVRSREIKRDWKRRNPESARRYAERRAHQVGHATPPWLTPEQRNEMAAVYREARARGRDWHVDHIVPLNGKTVCGLHVPWNLQILLARENMAKGNRLAA